MKTRLPKLPFLLAIALTACVGYLIVQHTTAGDAGVHSSEATAATPAADPGAMRQAEALLAEAVRQLESHYSIAADVRYQADLLGSRLGGGGHYREERSGPVPKVRLSLEMPVGDEMGALLEVCDGHYLWTYRRLAGDEKLTRIDVERVFQEMNSAGKGLPYGSPTGSVGLGGLAGMVRELHHGFSFELLGQADFHGEPAWRLRGRWRPRRLAEILPDQKDAILRGEPANLAKLPAHLPSEVLLTLGRDNRLPYRVEYRRQTGQGGGAAGEAEQGSVVLEWFNIRSGPVTATDFEFQPGDIELSDVTEGLIARLKARRSEPGGE